LKGIIYVIGPFGKSAAPVERTGRRIKVPKNTAHKYLFIFVLLFEPKVLSKVVFSPLPLRERDRVRVKSLFQFFVDRRSNS
jgi:hypothetical protein